ncbi:hypothetical protein QTN25_009281 [Entamoeba marina]
MSGNADCDSDYESLIISLWNYLLKWSNCTSGSVLYDSDRDGQSNECFNEKVIGKSNIFFINFDEFGNIYGTFVKKSLTKHNTRCIDHYFNPDNDHFIFSLRTDGKSQPTCWYLKKSPNGRSGIYLYNNEVKNNNCLYVVGQLGFMTIAKSTVEESDFYKLSNEYEDMNDFDLNGRNGWNERFIVDRVLVIQMSND